MTFQLERFTFHPCYIPVHKLIVGFVGLPTLFIRAVSCESMQPLWSLPAGPYGRSMVYSQKNDALLLNAGGQIHVHNPKTGSLRQVLSLGEKIGTVIELCLQDDQLFVIHSAGGVKKLSHFTVK